MDFLKFYGLKEDPFKLSPDPEYFFASEGHNVALNSMEYVVEQKEGFCVITGEPGTGKTTLINVFIDRWRDKAEIALILTPSFTPDELLQSVLCDLKVACRKRSKADRLKAFMDFLIKKSEEKRPVIVIVDEAQNLPGETMEELRLLSNFETEKEKLLQIILIGQPELESRLSTEALRQLDQRVTVRARLSPLAGSEVLKYMNSRLIKAGKGFLRLDDNMMRRVYKYSKGIPRLINLLSSRTIMSAYLEGHNVVTSRHVNYAISHLDGAEFRDRTDYSRVFYGAAAITLIIMAAAVTLSFLAR